MTMPYSPSRAIYEGNSAATRFPFSFKVWDASQLVVTLTSPGGLTTGASGWTADLGAAGGEIVYLHDDAPLPHGWKLAITRNMPFTQGVNLVSASRFDPQVIEDALDQATAERQQTLEMMQRAVILPATSSETPQDVVENIYTARDQAQSANSAAQAARQASCACAGEATAQADRAESSTVEQLVRIQAEGNAAQATIDTAKGNALQEIGSEVQRATGEADRAYNEADLARRWASEDEGTPVKDSEYSAKHYAAKAKEAVSDNLVERVGYIEDRVDVVEEKTQPATTTSRGIGRIATPADMQPGAAAANGPAFLAVTGGVITPVSTPHVIPKAGPDGRISVGFIPGLFAGDIRLLPFRAADLATHCPGWYFCNGDQYVLSTPVGQALNALTTNLKTDFGIVVSGGNISIPNMFYSDGRAYFFRAGQAPGVVQTDAIRNFSGYFPGGGYNPPAATCTGPFSIRAHGANAGQFSSSSAQNPSVAFDPSKVVPTAVENRPLNISMTPAIFLGV